MSFGKISPSDFKFPLSVLNDRNVTYTRNFSCDSSLYKSPVGF